MLGFIAYELKLAEDLKIGILMVGMAMILQKSIKAGSSNICSQPTKKISNSNDY